VNHFAQQQQQ